MRTIVYRLYSQARKKDLRVLQENGQESLVCFFSVFLVARSNILGTTCLSLCPSIAHSYGPLLVRRVFTNHHTSVIQASLFHYTQLCVCVSVYMCVYVYVSFH